MFIYPSSMTFKNFLPGIIISHDQSDAPELNLDEIAFRCMEGKREEIGSGSDSVVSLVRVSNDLNSGKVVVKAYTKLQEVAKHCGRAFETIKKYKNDTEIAHQIFNRNPNPLGQKITISGLECDVEHIVIPQGEAVQHINGTVCSIGQEFVSGKTLLDFLTNPTIKCTGTNKILNLNWDEINELNRINLLLMALFPTDARGRISSSALNVKPEINLKEQKVKFRITDLSDNLYSDYGAIFMGFAL